MKKIILASASPRRRELLSNIGVDFDVVTSHFDERSFVEEQLRIKGNISAAEQTMMLALGKAQDVSSSVKNTEDNVVIGVDTSVVVDDMILGKPSDREEALKMLRSLSGKAHKVISGFAIIASNGKTLIDYDETFVHMREILPEEAQYYVDNEYVLDKAGAYAIQGKASLFIEKIEGCYFNVVGLPIYKLARALREFDIDLSRGGI